MKRATYQHIIVVLTLTLFTLSTLALGVAISRAAPAGPHAYTPSIDGAPSAPQALPDLVLDEFTMIPSRPKVNEPVTITIQIRNAGAGNAPGWRANLYVDPPDQPPTSTTPYSKTTLYYVTFPPAAVSELTLSGYTFKSAGCDHVLYAWADPRQGIPESDETNNMRAIHLCVDAEGIPVVEEPPPSFLAVILTGAVTGQPNQRCTFTATLQAATAHLPLTYTWQATGWASYTYSINTLYASRTFSWTQVGDKIITVTISNSEGQNQARHSINITSTPTFEIHLPLIIKNHS